MSVAESDILIVGGGMVGASLAHALSSLSLKIAVVEAAPARVIQQPGYDDRSTALAYSSRRIFETLGLWRQLRAGATAIHEIHVSDRGRFGATRLKREEQQVEALGYVVENRTLGQVLWRELEQGNATLYCPARVVATRPGADALSVTLATEAGEVVCRTKLLVVADGARSATRELLGIETAIDDYGQGAVIANVTPERTHRNIAYERFTESGPLAMLPLSNGRCSVVWTLAHEQCEATMVLDDEAFLAALQSAFGYRLGRLQRAGARFSYPLSLTRARQITGARFVLIGNAANGLHPVAGQGFNLGLRDVASLAEVIAAQPDHADPGDARALRRYVEWRGEDHRRVVGFTDSLVRIFTASSTPVRLARGAALVALDLFGAPRAAFARQSMGLAGRVPRLARGIPLR